MTRYHINSLGNPGKCSARGRCPFGGDSEHHPSAEAARAAFEVQMTSKTSPVAVREENYLGDQLSIAANVTFETHQDIKAVSFSADEDWTTVSENDEDVEFAALAAEVHSVTLKNGDEIDAEDYSNLESLEKTITNNLSQPALREVYDFGLQTITANPSENNES